MPALLTSPDKVSPPSAASTCLAPAATAAPSVTSKRSGVKFGPNAADRRSASACLRTLPKTRAPSAIRTLTQPEPLPVDAPVTTTVFIEGLLENVPAETERRAGPMVDQQGWARHRSNGAPPGKRTQLFLVMTTSRYSLGRTRVPSLAALFWSSRA